MVEFVPTFLTVLILAALAVLVLSRKSDFTIRVSHGQVTCWGKSLPLVLRQALIHFINRELAKGRSFQVHGVWQGKRLRLWSTGDLSSGELQRIRNMLVNEL